ncbi:MAG: FAD-dependent oxidoreductase [Gammaproteobacteria bacterium]|nr:FAD-dependent oxidoreductase [Gammaproteobacteria bacterium]
MQELTLKDFSFVELFDVAGLRRLDQRFASYLQAKAPLLARRLLAYRGGELIQALELSEFLLAVAPLLEDFIAQLFMIESVVAQKNAATLIHDPIFAFKKYYLKAARRRSRQPEPIPFQELNQWLLSQVEPAEDFELVVAKFGQTLLQDSEKNSTSIQNLIAWCAAGLSTREGKAAVKGWVSFTLPERIDYANLVPLEKVAEDKYQRSQGLVKNWRQRDGFKLTDSRMTARQTQAEVNYCIYCHKNADDFCAHGFPAKKNKPELGFKIQPVTDETLNGCPLEEKISEMNLLKKAGHTIGALAMVMVDNPMCPATGHRICNDCMKSCIYQKQTPVNIPEIETRVLTDVLDLPWGVEIYDLLTRWNPLRQQQYLPKEYNGQKILVMGMGPAGFTLAHYLLMEGFAVVGADGVKLEPLPEHYLTQPIRDFGLIYEQLDDRIMNGFGGVAEYGITVRWDKNFLKLIYLSLLRRRYFQVFGALRFGGSLCVEDVWRLGFQHLTIAVGAGLPKELMIPNSLLPGMRQANDFLMALQLTGAAKDSSLANLQVRLPAVIIGGGLTGIDTATEVQAYYIKQVEKVYRRYQILIEAFGIDKVRNRFDTHALKILDEFIEHGRLVKQERKLALKEKRSPDLLRLIRRWGGVTIAYRKRLQDSPAYRRNHEEVIKALEEGIYYAEGLAPLAVECDAEGWVSGLTCQWKVWNEKGEVKIKQAKFTLPARSIYVATGAKPNVAYAFEHAETFTRQKFQYQRFKLNAQTLLEVQGELNPKATEPGFFTSYQQDDKRVSFIGDTHPVFHGSVVKAIASAKRAYPDIVAACELQADSSLQSDYKEFKSQLNKLLTATVVAITPRTENLIELKVHAPLAAEKFQPGQFYRLQNYATDAAEYEGTRLQTEALALIGIQRHTEPDTLAFMVQLNGVSSRLVATFKLGQNIALMGPTGARSKIPCNEGVIIFGAGLAIAHLLSVGEALKAAGNKIIFIGCFDQQNDIYCRTEIENLADFIVWLTPEPLVPSRLQDCYYHGDYLNNLMHCFKTGEFPVPLENLGRAVVVGGSQLIRTWQALYKKFLGLKVTTDFKVFASVYGPMQCMLKGVCAQCLQWQIDPKTGHRTKAVYACSWQNQPLERIDVANIDQRLAQNHTQEVLSNLWLDYLASRYNIGLADLS